MIRITSSIAKLLTIFMVATSFASACDWNESCQDYLYRTTLVNGEAKCVKDRGRCEKKAKKDKKKLRACRSRYYDCFSMVEILFLDRVDRFVDKDKCCDGKKFKYRKSRYWYLYTSRPLPVLWDK